jgi:hypothetical protein
MKVVRFFLCVHSVSNLWISAFFPTAFRQVIPTSAILKSSAILNKRSPQQVTHLPLVWDLLLSLTQDTQVQGILILRLIHYEAIEEKWLAHGGGL